MDHDNAPALAASAGLRYADSSMKWRRRIGRGRGFTYREPDGSATDEDTRDWIETLAIPPAWTKVEIATRRDSHLLVTGQDSAGRKQYIYHPVWEDLRQEVKFARMRDFGDRLARLRKRVDADLRRVGLPRVKVVALSVAVLDRTLIRIGNRRSAANAEAYGLTTLTTDHVEVNGSQVHLEFLGKGGSESVVAFDDRRLAALIARCEELSGQTLFSYTADDVVSSVGSGDVNAYLVEAMRGRFTAKDFRTWGATTTVVAELADSARDDPDSRVLEALDAAAARLGNSRDVCRHAYVHPGAIEAYHDGRLQEAWRKSRNGMWLQRAESAIVKILPSAEGGPGSGGSGR
jgi:DNA topoisomerase-1